MAASRPRGKNVKAKASEARPGCPYIRMPWERHRLAIEFDPEQGRTHQSFQAECDINNIIDLHTRTGMVTHLNPGKPQYADCPESTLFDAAVAQAEIRSAIEEGWQPPDDDSDREGDSPDDSEEAASAASEAAPEPSEGDKGGENEL